MPAPAPEEDPLVVLAKIKAHIQLVEEQRRRWVREARRLGYTWSQIGESLGVSQQAVSKRFGGR